MLLSALADTASGPVPQTLATLPLAEKGGPRGNPLCKTGSAPVPPSASASVHLPPSLPRACSLDCVITSELGTPAPLRAFPVSACYLGVAAVQSLPGQRTWSRLLNEVQSPWHHIRGLPQHPRTPQPPNLFVHPLSRNLGFGLFFRLTSESARASREAPSRR